MLRKLFQNCHKNEVGLHVSYLLEYYKTNIVVQLYFTKVSNHLEISHRNVLSFLRKLGHLEAYLDKSFETIFSIV